MPTAESGREVRGEEGAGTVVSLLARRTREDGGRRAYVLLDGAGRETESLTWGQLEAASRKTAAAIGARVGSGGRALLCYPHGLEYICSFFGCLRAGVTPVPAQPPWASGPRQHLERIRTIADDCGASLCLAPRGTSVEGLELPLPPLLETAAIEERSPAGDPGWQDARTTGDDLAFLMYTSGSTGTPKGIEITNANVLHNLSRFPFEGRPCRGVVSWLPFYHDLGLMLGILHPLYQGVPAVLMSPFSFAQDPLRWLHALSRYRASATGSPNFAYDYCVHARTDAGCEGLDLSCCNLALNGSEPVRAETLDRFVRAFEPYGFRREAFYPSYGLSDATATVSAPRGLQAPVVKAFSRASLAEGEAVEAPADARDARLLVGCGKTIDDQDIAIVDPESREPCPPGRVGEIWVAGPSIGRGVWGQPETTESRFHARPAPAGDGRYLRTADLGFCLDGELFITGRLDDLLIIQGVNYNPEEIEPFVDSSHASIRPGCSAAVVIDEPGPPRLLILCEVRPVADLDHDAVFHAIRTAVAEQLGLEVGEIGLLPAGTILKTSSGKIRRRRCRTEYLRGRLPLAARWQGPEALPSASTPAAPEVAPTGGPASPGTVEEWLTAHLAGRLGIPVHEIDVTRPLRDFGVHSLEAVRLAVDLEKRFGMPLPPTLAWEFPTLETIARHVSERMAGKDPQKRRDPFVDRQEEPIAIIGMGCRLPGAAGLDAFWDLLARGGDSVREAPAERWNVDQLYDPDPAAPGKMVTQQGGFLDGLDFFDADFFRITPREATHLDPRQRLVLETTFEAFEDAGLTLTSLTGSDTGVYIGVLSNDYDQLLYRSLERVEAYSGTGTANSVVANRLSYTFDLAGPSVALDTACSGSLTAIHLACQALRSGECSVAVAGGVSVNLLPNGNILFSKAGALSASGRCRPFDHRADGIVRSDGAGVVVLKPLSSALRDGDRIHAVIRGSALNQDGRSNGLMAPNGSAQKAVLREAYRRAGVAPGRVQYVEAHGTGTVRGDPIEVRALGEVLGEGRESGSECALGSLKSNLGHMEAAAGVASLIKVVLSLRHRQIPGSIHYEQPNPLIPFASLSLRVQEQLGPWPSPEERLIAGVSAFGFGGSNGHLVVEEPPAAEPVPPSSQGEPYVLPLSGASPEALEATIERLHDGLGNGLAGVELEDLCYTASVRRTHHASRRAIVARSSAEAAELLAALREEKRPDAEPASPARRPRPNVVFVFSGQGAHWPGMARDLWQNEEVFRAKLLECERLFREHVDWSVTDEIYPASGAGRLHRSDVSQVAVFSVQVALAALWSEWGLQPAAVVGQSLGEVAAAHFAGALGLRDAVRVVAHRSRLMQRTSGQGRTAVVGLPSDQAELLVAGLGGQVELAGSLSPSSTALAGDPAALEGLAEPLERRGVLFRLVPGVDVAFHSRQMEPLRPELIDALADLEPRSPVTPLFSTVLADEVNDTPLDAEYWGRNLRQPFRLGETIQALMGRGFRTFLEIGAHPVLAGSLRQCAGPDEAIDVLGSMRRDREARPELLAAVAGLYERGVDFDWRAMFRSRRRLVALPSYPWQRQRFWFDQIEVKASASSSPAGDSVPHPLLHRHWQSSTPPEQLFWESELAPATLHYLDDHQVEGANVFPGAALVEMALFAGLTAFGGRGAELRDVRFREAMVLSADRPRTVQLVLRPQHAGGGSFRISSRTAAQGWTLHADGLAVPLDDDEPDRRPGRPGAPVDGASEISAEEHYRRMSEIGLQYGASFRAIRHIVAADSEARGELQLPGQSAVSSAYTFHPVLLDSLFQLGAAADGYQPLWPVGVTSLRLWRRPTGRLVGTSRVVPDSDGADRRMDYEVYDEDGEAVAEIRGLLLKRRREESVRDSGGGEPYYELEWTPGERTRRAATTDRPAGTWLLLTDGGGLGDRLGQGLAETGATVVRVRAGEGYRPPRPDEVATVSADRDEDFQRLVSDLSALALPDVQAVVHLWSLDDRPAEQTTTTSLEAAQTTGCQAILSLVRHLADLRHQLFFEELSGSPTEDPLRLWIVTQGTQADRPARIESASLWGLSRTLAQEHGDIWGGIVDLSPALSADEAVERLLPELLDRDGEDHLRLEKEGRLVQRVVRAAAPAARARPVEFRRDATYLVVGGLGGIGLRLAEWMVQQEARRLVLMNNTRLPPRSEWSGLDDEHPARRQVAAVQRLESQGAEILVASLDIADADRVRGFLDEYRREARPPIRGVVHSAAVVSDRVLAMMDPETLMSVLRPKVLGAWNLHQFFEKEELDFFVLFSSVASFIPVVGQGNYAAANAFLDALAHYRQGIGLPATSINWGSWAEVGLVSRLKLEDQHRRNGMFPFAPDRGLEIFSRLLAEAPAQKIAMDVDWQRLLAIAGSPPPLLVGVAQQARSEDDWSDASADGVLQLLETEPEASQRLQIIEQHLLELVAQSIRIQASKIPRDRPLQDLGVDSIVTTEIQGRIFDTLHVRVPVSVLLLAPGLEHLAARVDEGLERPSASAGAES